MTNSGTWRRRAVAAPTSAETGVAVLADARNERVVDSSVVTQRFDGVSPDDDDWPGGLRPMSSAAPADRAARVRVNASLGLRLVLAASFARIHWQNLTNFGVLPLELVGDNPRATAEGDMLTIRGLAKALHSGDLIEIHNTTKNTTILARHRLSPRQIDVLLAGGRIPHYRARHNTAAGPTTQPQRGV